MGMQLTGMPTRYSIQLCPAIPKPMVNLQNGFQMMMRVVHTSLKYAGQMALSAHDVEEANTGWTKQGFTGVISVFLNRR